MAPQNASQPLLTIEYEWGRRMELIERITPGQMVTPERDQMPDTHSPDRHDMG